MDILDEKVNGGPPMEIVDDVVSVRDRQYASIPLSLTPLTPLPRRGIRCQAYARPRA